MADTRIDVDAILASLPPDVSVDPGDPWGSANLTSCGGACCHNLPVGTSLVGAR